MEQKPVEVTNIPGDDPELLTPAPEVQDLTPFDGQPTAPEVEVDLAADEDGGSQEN